MQNYFNFNKMRNNISSSYLCNLIPDNIGQNITYNLRNQNDIEDIKCKTNLYAKSFLPDTIRKWNELPNEYHQAETIKDFKLLLNGNVASQPTFDYSYGLRFCQITHCRLRLGCSDLNGDKLNRHIADISTCQCGFEREDAIHYFFTCPKYEQLRREMVFYVDGHNINSVLHGNSLLSKELNLKLLNSVHDFILKSKRFSY